MNKPSFVYVIYISTTPEKVYAALTDGEATKLYWGHHKNVSDWQVGSPWRHEDYDDPSQIDVAGEVVEAAPPRRLVLTWGSAAHAGDPSKRSRVTFDIEPFMDAVRLTVTHEDLPAEDLTIVSQGWQAILSSLKSLLETGKPLSMTARRWGRRGA